MVTMRKQCSFSTVLLLAPWAVLVKGLSTWSYGHGGDVDGPSLWGGLCGSGQAQSPVNLEPNSTLAIERWTYSNSYRYKVPCTLTNTGNSLQLFFNTSKPTTISGGDLNGTFLLSHGLVHWGRNDNEGSEHLLKGRAFPLEIQLVHYNSVYGSYETSLGKKDGLAVLAILHELEEKNNTKLTPIIDSLYQISNPGSSYNIEKTMQPCSLLPVISSPIYRYTGSLTSPPCTELVTWTVFHPTSTVSSAQLAKLRSLLQADGSKMIQNFRPTVRLNNRTVIVGSAYLSRKVTPRKSSEVVRTLEKSNSVLSLKSGDKSWYLKPAPLWTVVVLGMILLMVGMGLAIYKVRRRLSKPASHLRVPTDDIELETTAIE